MKYIIKIKLVKCDRINHMYAYISPIANNVAYRNLIANNGVYRYLK